MTLHVRLGRTSNHATTTKRVYGLTPILNGVDVLA